MPSEEILLYMWSERFMAMFRTISCQRFIATLYFLKVGTKTLWIKERIIDSGSFLRRRIC